MKNTQIFPITEEDKVKIFYATHECQCGELYRFLGVKKEDTIDKIAHSYKQVRSNFENDKEIAESLDAAYSVISDKRLRDYYDREIHDEMATLELEYFKSLNQKNHTLLSIMGTLAAPFEIASLVINTTPNHSNSLKVLKSFIRNNNAFSLGKIILAQAIVPSTIAISLQPLFILKDKFAYPFSTMGKLTDEILWCFTSFVVAFPLDCYIQSANKLSFLEVIKKVVLCQDGVTGKFNFKNITYTFISSVGIYATSRLLKGIINKLIEYVESKSLENPKSTFWRNSTLIIKSIYTKTFLLTLALVPCETVRSQFSCLFVQRYLGNSVNILSTSPISIAVDLVKTQGYRKLYKSFPFTYVTFLLNEFLTSTVK
ncbi:hypothetical protein ACTFIY_002697 [Dictyostelium cf. discoideum]